MEGDEYVEALKLVRALDFFLITAPVNWHENQIIRRYYLNKEEGFVSCVYWNNLYFITGTDIVRCIAYKMHHLGRKITDRKKFEEGIFSDLRSLKSGTHAVLEDARSPFLKFLHKNQCLRTQKKQKVFFWFSVPHQKLFSDVLERDLKREQANQSSTTVTTNSIMKSFKFDQSGTSILEQYANHVKNVTGHSVNQLILKTIPETAQPSAITPIVNDQPLQTPLQQYQPTPIQMQQYALASAQDETFLMNLFDGDLNFIDPVASTSNDHQQQQYMYQPQSQMVNSANSRYVLGSNGQFQMLPPVYPTVSQQQQNRQLIDENDRDINQPQVISSSFPNNFFVIPGLTPITKAPSMNTINQPQPSETISPNIPRLPSISSANFPHMIPLMISPTSMLNTDLTLDSNKESTEKDSKDPLINGKSNQMKNNSLMFPISGIPSDLNTVNSATFNHYFPSGIIEDLSTSHNENSNLNNGLSSSITNTNSFIFGKIFTPSTINFLDSSNGNNIQNNIQNNGFSPVIGFKNGMLSEKNKVIDSGKISKQSIISKKKLLNPALRHLDLESIYDEDEEANVKVESNGDQLSLSLTNIEK